MVLTGSHHAQVTVFEVYDLTVHGPSRNKVLKDVASGQPLVHEQSAGHSCDEIFLETVVHSSSESSGNSVGTSRKVTAPPHHGCVRLLILTFAALFSVLSGIIGERLPIRHYLTFGMLASGAFTALFGLGYFYNIHSLGFYVVTQVRAGSVASQGPGVCDESDWVFGPPVPIPATGESCGPGQLRVLSAGGVGAGVGRTPPASAPGMGDAGSL